MNRKFIFSAVAIAISALSAGCATTSPSQSYAAANKTSHADRVAANMEASATASPGRVIIHDKPFIPASMSVPKPGQWLTRHKVTLKVGDTLALTEALRMFAAQGINVVSDLPLDQYAYAGFGFNNLDAETALRVLVGAVGLDYTLDDERQTVTIHPLSSQTWFLNLGNRKASFTAGTSTTTSNASTSGNRSGTDGVLAASTGGLNASANISSVDEFWSSLKVELENRLKPLVPEGSSAGGPVQAALPIGLPELPGSSRQAPSMQIAPRASGTAVPKQIGTFSLNPETGAVSVAAPKWVLKDLDTYFKRVQDMYNTDIVFSGMLISVSSDNSDTEGLDISAFARFANGRYGAVFQNNALGGVTLTFPQGGGAQMPGISGAGNAIAPTLIGITSPLDGLQLFNAYLSNHGQVRVMQKPVVATTSGVPGDFRRTVTRYYNTVTQQTSGGTGDAAVGTQNTLVSIELGTMLRINPRFDVSTGLIRAHIVLEQTNQVGEQNIPQSLTAGNTVSQINVEVPIVSKVVYSGEALLKDGDLVIVGGQMDQTNSDTVSGVTKLMDVPVAGAAFGKRNLADNKSVTYFAMRVNLRNKQ